MQPHIAFLTPMAHQTVDAIKRLTPAHCTIAFAASTDPGEQLEMVRHADVIMAAGTFVTADIINNAPRLKLIQKWGIGVDKIDLEAARQAGVTVAITAGATSIPVSEHTLMLMLAVSRRLPLAHRSLQEGKWIAAELRTICSKLEGKTVGLFGFGNIARCVAKRLSGFDVNLIYHSRTRLDPAIEKQYNARYVDFDTLLAQSDILSLHAPLTAQTKHLFNANTFEKMKRGAMLINTARGELVDEPALVEALRRGQLSSAGLDTFEGEPPAIDHPLLHMDQVVVTPHAAGGVYDNVPHIVGHMFRNVDLYFNKQPLDAADIIVSHDSPNKQT
ncbi:2-hydroxyacid dehydrogenase [Zwartia sp.]|uniref:2-hydroxyacid dehydrogenase n=1 Tax=Zwartia sp. TaxID=2978004 RepID=UPI00271C2EF6|nr:2-hydroxyacid dehydrogenase [Zwartia sp.]MDO9024223.1 2-hydroxyacid dehydrogenase [Zwartia sp.]